MLQSCHRHKWKLNISIEGFVRFHLTPIPSKLVTSALSLKSKRTRHSRCACFLIVMTSCFLTRAPTLVAYIVSIITSITCSMERSSQMWILVMNFDQLFFASETSAPSFPLKHSSQKNTAGCVNSAIAGTHTSQVPTRES